MKMDTEYSVRVIMADGSEAWVCPFTPWDVDPKNRSSQGLDNAQMTKAQKILRNGQLLIMCNGQVFDAQGRKIYDY